jgi:Flp pilus assembly protein TadG
MSSHGVSASIVKVAMFKRIRNKIASPMQRCTRCFVRRQDGAAAVEFALIAVPFIGLFFAILETALVFFAGQTLENAASEAGRLVMTGQAQTTAYTPADPTKTGSGSVPFTADDFKSAVCDYLAGGLFDCANGVYVNVRTFNNFGSVDNSSPVTNGQFDTTKMNYAPGGPGCIVTVTLYYQWPVYVTFLGDNLTNLNGGNRLLVATSVFRNEPFGPAGTC